MSNTFSRLITHDYMTRLVKEARRVKYLVEGEVRSHYTVKDDESGALVFRGIYHRPFWIATFSSLYFEPNEVPQN